MISSFDQALQYLYSHIPKSTGRMFPGEVGLARMNALVTELGNPQEKYKTVHIAGTSGKGSTATIVSHLLKSQGFKVGLQLSPHVLDIRERIQINNSLLDKHKFLKYLNEIVPAVEKMSKGDFGQVTYFEILVSLAYYSFWKEGVAYAVIETGMGGLYDGTNIIKNPQKLAVITRIGHDHMSVLGKTLPQIAKQKAGIIHKGNIVITIEQSNDVLNVIESESDVKQAELAVIKSKDYSVESISKTGTKFYDGIRKQKLHLGLIGSHQVENAMLALEAVSRIAQRDNWNMQSNKTTKVLQELKFPARMDVVTYKQKTLVIDGAHNSQKMRAFLKSLSALYPREKFVFLVAFKHGKDIKQMMSLLQKYAKEIVVTDFFVGNQDMPNISESADRVASYATVIPVQAISGADKALEYALKQDDKVIVTGSLYFASEIYSLLKAKS